MFLLAAAMCIRRTHVFSDWLAWLGLAAAVVGGIIVFALFARYGVLSPYSPLGFFGAFAPLRVDRSDECADDAGAEQRIVSDTAQSSMR